MKTGRTLQELAAELDRQAAGKKDYLVDTRAINLRDTGSAQHPV